MPLGERGFCLAGDYDTMLSRLPLFNVSIKDHTRCVQYRDFDGNEKSFRPWANFLKYRHYESPLSSTRTFAFRLVNVYQTPWEAYLEFRRRSSIVVDSMTRYEDLFATLTNIGTGKQSNFQAYYKKFQRSVLDKKIPFYHLRAQLVHGEFEMRKPVLYDRETHFSTPFLNYVQQNLLADNEGNENGTSPEWDEKLFLLFGTHYVRRAFFGGYIDLMITPWDTVCEMSTPARLSALARCVTVKLNTKFGLGRSRDPPPSYDTESACAGLNFWMQNDQDIFVMVSGSDYDFQTAVSIGVRYPVYRDGSDKPLMRGWLYSLADTPGMVEATVEPICEVFPNEMPVLKVACKKNLLRYMRNNEPLLRSWEDNSLEDCDGGKKLTVDVGFNVLREGCVFTKRSRDHCPTDTRAMNGGASFHKDSFGPTTLLVLMSFYCCSRRYVQ